MSMQGARRPLEGVKTAVLESASNLHVCGLIAVASSGVLLIAALIIDAKATFLLAGTPVVIVAVSLIQVALRAEPRPLDIRIAHELGRVASALLPAGPLKPNVLSAFLYYAGVIGGVAGYGYLALTSSSVVAANEEIIRWGLMDKRPLVFGYLAIVAFIAFRWFMASSLFGQDSDGSLKHAAEHPPSISQQTRLSRWTSRILGGALIAFLTYCWLALPALRAVSTGIQQRRPVDDRGLADFYELHIHVHLGALEQIRLGAMPYLEAETQYGLGNQVLMYFLTNFIHFSNHGFFAANILVNAVCVVGFFLILQQFLGLGWAIAGLIGWVILPSPHSTIDFAGWTILSRWLAIPILSLLLANLLLRADPKLSVWVGPVFAGAIWGMGSFLSQENLSGGLLVFLLSMALFGPVSGMQLRGLARFSSLFVASGALALAGLVATFIGISHFLEVFKLANIKSGMVMAGVSNSLWSENLQWSMALTMINGRLQNAFVIEGEVRPLFQTYGFAVLLVVAVALMSGFLGRRWQVAGEANRAVIGKFVGVAVGAYVLHLFTLLRSDTSHLAGPSILLPLFVLMLPLFAWRCVEPGLLRSALLVVSAAVIFEASVAGRSEIGRKLSEVSGVWNDSITAFQTYGGLRNARGATLDLATRYSPSTTFQARFRDHPDFNETRELFGLLHDRLRGRRVELGFERFNALIDHPEAFYFFGSFRSVSGITSPKNSIWSRSEENAWIDKVVNAKAACVFFEPNADTRLLRAWEKSVSPAAVVTEPVVGRRLYGILSCKT